MIKRNWLECPAMVSHGRLIERPIFTQMEKNNQTGQTEGAVLRHIKRFSRAYLEPSVNSVPTIHESEQEILYVVNGKGRISIENREEDVREGTIALIPPGKTHCLINEQSEPLEILILTEDVSEHLRDKAKNIVIKNYHELPVITEHWRHINRHLLSSEDGLTIIHKVIIVRIEPNTVSEPHKHPPNTDEVWYVLKSEGVHWIDRDVCVQREGDTVICIPAEAVHSLINHTERPWQLFYFAHYGNK